MNNQPNYVIGVDYGTDSVRALLVDAESGAEIALSVFEYPRWKNGLYCNPSKNQFRQHPLDYIEGLEFTIREIIRQCPDATHLVKGISIDTTGSTPIAVDSDGTPLALKKGFETNPNAMFVLWKDHTAIKEADEINHLCRHWGGLDFSKYSGGIYSSEWYWSKVLHIIREDKSIANNCFSWVEHCDWMPALLTGKTNPKTMKRGRCAAGHKALWHADWSGFPSDEFLVNLDPQLVDFKHNMPAETITADIAVGTLSKEWADSLGLNESVVVGSGAFDAHIGAVGGEIKPYYLSKVIGTSTCDMLIAPRLDMQNIVVKGICGQVDGSIVNEMDGMEAGQSAFGDIYAWFKKVLMWPVENILASTQTVNSEVREKLISEISDNLIKKLTEEAEQISIGESGLVALDWMNGRRTPDANQNLKGVISGINLGSDAPRIFRSLVEATAFGSKAIVDRFKAEGVRIDGVVALGGVAKKSPFIMQILADVLNVPIQVVASEQTCALGSAMYAAVAAGIYPNIHLAQVKMGQGFEKTYQPISENSEKYQLLYDQYNKLGKLIEQNQL
ncbi:MAG: ribulokinase [Bacteroidales bacterium]|nr:ribulokinase [Bacteroidales bacterium]